MMELDEIKSVWAQYDKKLSKNLVLNEELLKQLKVVGSKSKLHKPFMAVVTSVVFMFYMTVVFMILSDYFIGEPQYSIPALISTGVALVYFIFGMIKMYKLVNIGYSGASITELQQQTAEANRLILRLRKYELLFSPAFIIALPPIFKALHNIDLYQDVKSFVVTGLVSFAVLVPAALWINKYVYDKKVQNTERLLKEIEEYKLEK